MKRIVFLIAWALAGYVRAHPVLPQEGDEPEHIRAYLRLSDHLATSGQILYEQVKDIKKAGFEVVVNLAPAHKERNALEDFLVTEQSMTYIHIPVSWTEPSLRDLKLFFDVMKANADRKTYVHCFANMRVSVFVYLYRTLRLGVPEETARRDLLKIWDPATKPQWAQFMERAREQWKQPSSASRPGSPSK